MNVKIDYRPVEEVVDIPESKFDFIYGLLSGILASMLMGMEWWIGL